MTRQEAIDWLQSLTNPHLGDQGNLVHRDELLVALNEPPLRHETLHDDDGHRYLVPEDRVQAFQTALDQINCLESLSAAWYDACEDFTAQFGQFRH